MDFFDDETQPRAGRCRRPAFRSLVPSPTLRPPPHPHPAPRHPGGHPLRRRLRHRLVGAQLPAQPQGRHLPHLLRRRLRGHRRLGRARQAGLDHHARPHQALAQGAHRQARPAQPPSRRRSPCAPGGSSLRARSTTSRRVFATGMKVRAAGSACCARPCSARTRQQEGRRQGHHRASTATSAVPTPTTSSSCTCRRARRCRTTASAASPCPPPPTTSRGRPSTRPPSRRRSTASASRTKLTGIHGVALVERHRQEQLRRHHARQGPAPTTSPASRRPRLRRPGPEPGQRDRERRAGHGHAHAPRRRRTIKQTGTIATIEAGKTQDVTITGFTIPTDGAEQGGHAQGRAPARCKGERVETNNTRHVQAPPAAPVAAMQTLRDIAPYVALGAARPLARPARPRRRAPRRASRGCAARRPWCWGTTSSATSWRTPRTSTRRCATCARPSRSSPTSSTTRSATSTTRSPTARSSATTPSATPAASRAPRSRCSTSTAPASSSAPSPRATSRASTSSTSPRASPTATSRPRRSRPWRPPCRGRSDAARRARKARRAPLPESRRPPACVRGGRGRRDAKRPGRGRVAGGDRGRVRGARRRRGARLRRRARRAGAATSPPAPTTSPGTRRPSGRRAELLRPLTGPRRSRRPRRALFRPRRTSRSHAVRRPRGSPHGGAGPRGLIA